MTGSPKDVAAWIRQRKHPLLCTHVRPDGDAYGSLLGLLIALDSSGADCSAYISSSIPARYAEILPHPENLFVNTDPDQNYDSILLLDTASPDRADVPEGIDPAQAQMPVANLDHHPDNSLYADVNYVNPAKAATAALLIDVLECLDLPLTPPAATCLLTGLVMDCGGFRFRNTDADALRTAANLVESGADLHAVMDSMFFQEPLGVKKLKAELLRNAQFAFDGRLVYAFMDADCRSRHGVGVSETEGVIDVLRSIKGVCIACLIQPQGDTVRLSLRARDASAPVDGIARQLGGGGHLLAAGAELNRTNVRGAEQKLLACVERVLNDE